MNTSQMYVDIMRAAFDGPVKLETKSDYEAFKTIDEFAERIIDAAIWRTNQNKVDQRYPFGHPIKENGAWLRGAKERLKMADEMDREAVQQFADGTTDLPTGHSTIYCRWTKRSQNEAFDVWRCEHCDKEAECLKNSTPTFCLKPGEVE